jgi:hypothetical protein
MYIQTVIGPDPNVWPHQHKMPKLTLAFRAAEYDMDPEDPFALDLVMREYFYHDTDKPHYEKGGVHPLFYLPSVEEARTFMESRIEEVRVDRKAPQGDSRLLAGAVKAKAATKALVEVRDIFLKSVDKRVAEPIQFYRDQSRDRMATRQRAGLKLDPVEVLLRGYQRDKAGLLEKR